MELWVTFLLAFNVFLVCCCIKLSRQAHELDNELDQAHEMLESYSAFPVVLKGILVEANRQVDGKTSMFSAAWVRDTALQVLANAELTKEKK